MAAGIRRIEAVAGPAAVELLMVRENWGRGKFFSCENIVSQRNDVVVPVVQQRNATLESWSKKLVVPPEQLSDRLAQLCDKVDKVGPVSSLCGWVFEGLLEVVKSWYRRK